MRASSRGSVIGIAFVFLSTIAGLTGTGYEWIIESSASASVDQPIPTASPANYLPLVIGGRGSIPPTNTPVSLTNTPIPPTNTPVPPPPSLFETVLSVITETSYVTASDSDALDLGTGDGEDFTIETFFYVSDLNYDPTVVDMLARKNHSYALYVKYNSGSSDSLFFQLWTDFDTSVTLGYMTDLSLGWHHVAAVFDNEFTENEDLMAIYLDGNRVAFSPDQNIHVDWTPGILVSSSELEVGGVRGGGAGFNDLIEEMRFSDSIRYSSTSYSMPTDPFSDNANTRALWHFDEPAGSSTFIDSSSHNNTLTGHEALTEEPVSDYALTVTPLTRTVLQGQAATYNVMLTDINGFTKPVSLSVSGLSTDITSMWSANPVMPTGDTTLSISTTANALTGSHILTISGIGGTQTHSVQVDLIITADTETDNIPCLVVVGQPLPPVQPLPSVFAGCVTGASPNIEWRYNNQGGFIGFDLTIDDNGMPVYQASVDIERETSGRIRAYTGTVSGKGFPSFTQSTVNNYNPQGGVISANVSKLYQASGSEYVMEIVQFCPLATGNLTGYKVRYNDQVITIGNCP